MKTVSSTNKNILRLHIKNNITFIYASSGLYNTTVTRSDYALEVEVYLKSKYFPSYSWYVCAPLVSHCLHYEAERLRSYLLKKIIMKNAHRHSIVGWRGASLYNVHVEINIREKRRWENLRVTSFCQGWVVWGWAGHCLCMRQGGLIFKHSKPKCNFFPPEGVRGRFKRNKHSRSRRELISENEKVNRQNPSWTKKSDAFKCIRLLLNLKFFYMNTLCSVNAWKIRIRDENIYTICRECFGKFKFNFSLARNKPDSFARRNKEIGYAKSRKRDTSCEKGNAGIIRPRGTRLFSVLKRRRPTLEATTRLRREKTREPKKADENTEKKQKIDVEKSPSGRLRSGKGEKGISQRSWWRAHICWSSSGNCRWICVKCLACTWFRASLFLDRDF